MRSQTLKLQHKDKFLDSRNQTNAFNPVNSLPATNTFIS